MTVYVVAMNAREVRSYINTGCSSYNLQQARRILAGMRNALTGKLKLYKVTLLIEEQKEAGRE